MAHFDAIPSFAGMSGTSNIATNIGYHPNGVASGLTYGNGQVYLKTLNMMQRPQQVKVSKPGTTAFDRSYAYDATGLITSITDATDAAHNQAFTYDGLGQLSTASGSWGTGTFDYDSLGNIREKDFSNWLGGARTVAMSYNAQNRLASYTDSGTGPDKTLSYDARGNVTALGVQNFTYDAANQPRALSGTTSGTYQYDGNLKRVKSVVDGKTIYNVYDASGMLVHVDNVTDVEATDYVTGAGMTLARIKNNAITTYLHNDHIGSTAVGTGAAGTVWWTERYSPFGELISGNPANDNLAAYTGHIRDTATGLTYMQARYYDPVIGRFLSVDPVTFMDTGEPNFFNRYAYAFNDPINLIDPDGMAPGDRFDTPEEAGRDAVEFINPTSIEENREYGGEIRRDVTTTTNESGETKETTQYYATEPRPGEVASVELRVSKSKDVGDYHTHGDYSKKSGKKTSKSRDDYDSDNRSSDDRSNSRTFAKATRPTREKYGEKYTSVLGFPNKKTKVYTRD